MNIKHLTLAILLATVVAVPGVASAHLQERGTLHEFGEMVEYPMLFPVATGASYTYFYETFWAARSDGIHHATDIMAPKMTPVIAPKDGQIRFVNWSSNTSEEFPNPSRCCNLTIDFDDGWSGWFIHLNNDTPGTDDGEAWGIAPGIRPGVRVRAGQLVGWVGDSGNAEETGPHLHFELRDTEGTIVNPYEALVAAPRVDLSFKCQGKAVTIKGGRGADLLIGTEGDDVIHGRGGNDVIRGMGGNDLICGGTGDDTIDGGDGNDRIKGQGGHDTIDGADGDDHLYGDSGHDIIDGGEGRDRIYGGSGNDRLSGGGGNDHLVGSVGDDRLHGGDGNDRLIPGSGTDYAYGDAGRDTFFAGPGSNLFEGNDGIDVIDYRAAPNGAIVDLVANTGIGAGTDLLSTIEDIRGSGLADLLMGDGGPNVISGLGGDDMLMGRAGDDVLIGGQGADEIDGGDDVDRCVEGLTINCEAT